MVAESARRARPAETFSPPSHTITARGSDAHAQQLLERIVDTLAKLKHTELLLPSDEPSSSRIRLQFKDQIDRLRGKLVQMAGERALDSFDDEMRRRYPGKC